jgi:PhnB protein
MSIKAAIPYLFFNGTAERAARFYERALGARIDHLQHYSTVPNSGCQAVTDADRLIHGSLTLGGAMLMLSDVPSSDAAPQGDNVHVCLDFSDVGELEERFAALAEGGVVKLPLHDAFWGARFGMLTDQFGIQWMLQSALTQP